jgi:hypothetical protein
MEFKQQLMPILIGGAVGFASAFIGALVQFRINGSQNASRSRLPGCAFLVSGALGLVGLLVVAGSLLITGRAQLAVISGAGVLVGYFAGYAALIITWLVLSKRL